MLQLIAENIFLFVHYAINFRHGEFLIDFVEIKMIYTAKRFLRKIAKGRIRYGKKRYRIFSRSNILCG